MREYDNKPRSRGSSRMFVTAAAVVLVAGVTFAAVGVDAVRTWFVKVDVGGEQARLIVNDGETGQMIIEEDDGTTTTIAVSKDTSDGAEETRVAVTREGDGFEDENVKMIRKRRTVGEADESEHTVEDLGDAEPAYTWNDGADEIYFIEDARAGVTNVFLANTDADGNTTVRLATALPRTGMDLDNARIDMDDSGALTIKSDDGMGNVNVMKFRVAAEADLDNLEDANDVNIPMPDGDVRVRIQEHGGN